MGVSTSQQLDDALLRMSSNQIEFDELINLEIELLKCSDKEKTETFFQISVSLFSNIWRM